jgi:hypothetical protein
MTRRLLPALLVCVLAVVLAACGALDRLPDGGGSQQQATRDSNTAAQKPPADTRESRERSVEAGSADSGEAFGSTTGQHPNWFGDATVPLQLDVTRLQRNGDLVELEMVLTVTTDAPDTDFSPWSHMADATRAEVYDISGVRLVSQRENKAYLPAIDSSDVCLCTSGLDKVHLGAGDTVSLSATFGGVPAEVTESDLQVPGFSPLTGLTIRS